MTGIKSFRKGREKKRHSREIDIYTGSKKMEFSIN